MTKYKVNVNFVKGATHYLSGETLDLDPKFADEVNAQAKKDHPTLGVFLTLVEEAETETPKKSTRTKKAEE